MFKKLFLKKFTLKRVSQILDMEQDMNYFNSDPLLTDLSRQLPELGTRHNCRNNVTMFSGSTFFCILLYGFILLVATPFRYRGFNFFHSFACH